MMPGNETPLATGFTDDVRRGGLTWRERALERLLGGLVCGRLTVVLPTGATFTRSGRDAGPEATLILHRWRAVMRLATGGDIGFAESFMDGDWTSPDLTAVIRLAACNSGALQQAIQGSWPIRLANRVRHALNANSKRGSRRNIEAHYDLGNDFYSLWLDESMLYSSAIWTPQTGDLAAAQQNKLAAIRAALAPKAGDSVLEIGCGWGALAAALARDDGAQITGLTLSPSQLAWARDTVAPCGDAVELRIQDYRDVMGPFDRIVSIEMFEAVGEAYWPTYFTALKRCLKPEGRVVLQVISIAEDRFDAYRRESDFIQKHVFPGGFLPTKTAIRREGERAGLVTTQTQFFGHSYALTLAAWRRRFMERWPEIAALGFDEQFRRKWDYYFSYCEAGFLEGWIDVGLYTLEHAPAHAPADA